MVKSGLDFGINIFLNRGPVFWLSRRVLGDQWAQVTWVNGGEDSALGHGIEVIDDCGMTRLAWNNLEKVS
jgi:hypothetical protein